MNDKDNITLLIGLVAVVIVAGAMIWGTYVAFDSIELEQDTRTTPAQILNSINNMYDEYTVCRETCSVNALVGDERDYQICKDFCYETKLVVPIMVEQIY